MSEFMLEVLDLKKYYDATTGALWWKKPAAVRAVDGISFRLEKGKTLGLVGESGSGKSTVARLMLHLIEKSDGEILFDGKALDSSRRADMRLLRRQAQIVFQDPYSSLNPRMTVGDSITEALTVFGVDTASGRRSRARDLLAEVGLEPEYADRHPHEFSGGQRQRIGIARAIAMEPRLVVLDEAVSALDMSVQAQVVNLLQDLQEAHGLTYVFISHDLGVTRLVSDTVAVMYLGRIVEIGPVDEVFDRPMHPYTRALIDSIPDPHEEPKPLVPLTGEIPSPLDIPIGCRFRTRCPRATKLCAEVDPPEASAGAPGHRYCCHHPLLPSG